MGLAGFGLRNLQLCFILGEPGEGLDLIRAIV